ncbi:nucleotide disphospho-sugar-binding domain-containing protein [Streptomyces albidoflavus]
MSQSHIAFFNVPAHGHVQPSLGLVQELVQRGHRVTYAISGEFADVVATAGAEPVVYASSLPPKTDEDAWNTDLTGHLRLFLADAGRAVPQLDRAYRGSRPDLVLHDPVAYAGRVLAGRWTVPEVQVSPTAVAWTGYDAEAAAGPHGWLSAHSLAAGRAARPPERCVVVVSRALQPHADRVDPSVHTFVGPCRAPAEGTPGGERWTRPAGAGTVVLVSLGTIFNKDPGFYRACVEAFAALPGWHVVLQTGEAVGARELGPLPAHVELRGWIPGLSLLDEADLFVTHAGPGSVQVAMAKGVPMVVVPQAADQFGNARVLEELGVARGVAGAREGGVSPAALREAALELLGDPRVAARCAEVRDAMAAEGGAAAGADVVEEVLAGRAGRG